jgi:DNA-binding NarL/FixJ family response regulator
VRIVIAEDSVLLREGLCRLLADKHHHVCAAVTDAEALLAAVATHQPDVAVVDIRLPPSFSDEGLRAAIRIRAEHPEVGVLVLSQYVVERYATRLLGGDVRGVGYLLKDRVADVREFLEAVTRIGNGGTVLDSDVVSQLISRSRQGMAVSGLTEREQQVLSAMAEGRSNASIARFLHISESSIEKHVASIFAKLDLAPDQDTNRRVLAVLAYLSS